MFTAQFPNPGEIFQDRYRIASVLNSGGFGRVYLAKQIELNRDVAIKVLQPVKRNGLDAQQEAQRLNVVSKRFEREAHLVSQLRDSHTVVMYDFGATESGLLYMVLEFVNGKSLDAVASDGALAPERVVKITRQVLSSLDEAHALGMLHRDIKPQNIMLFNHAGRIDQVKVLDFGLAKSVEGGEFNTEDPDLTGEEVILGTPRYMSPEQIRGGQIGPPTDLYSLGLVMYEMLTGTKAVQGESTMKTLARHLNEVPFALPAELPIPGALREIVDQMLDKDSAQRVQSARAALELLERWDRPSLAAAATAPVTAEVDDISMEMYGERKKRMAFYIAGAVMALFLLLGIIASMVKGSDESPTDPAVIAGGETPTKQDETPESEGLVFEETSEESEADGESIIAAAQAKPIEEEAQPVEQETESAKEAPRPQRDDEPSETRKAQTKRTVEKPSEKPPQKKKRQRSTKPANTAKNQGLQIRIVN